MKSYSKFFIGLGLAASFGMVACVDDLDVKPTDPNVLTSADFASDPEGYMLKELAGCYQQISTSGPDGGGSGILSEIDGGWSTFQRGVFTLNELTTDTYIWMWPNDQNGALGELCYDNFSTANSVIYGIYSRFYANIAICNQFLRNVDANAFVLNDSQKALAEEYKRQARIIRGINYFYLLDFYGNVAWVDETMYLEAGEQATRTEIFTKLVEDLEDVSAAYGDSYATPAYGYVGKEACDALLAKIYLNAEVYTGSTEYWAKCADKCKKIIAAHVGDGFENSGLAENYLTLFGANNKNHTLGGAWPNEIIWTIPSTNNELQSYGNSTFMIASGVNSDLGAAAIASANFNFHASWACMHTRQQFAQLFTWSAAPDGDGVVSPDKRTGLWYTGTKVSINNAELKFECGYSNCKFTNYAYNEDGTYDLAASPSGDNDFSDGDYPQFRLADIYLTLAECALHGAFDQATAWDYVNLIRRRAGIGDATSQNDLASAILDERGRELYGENCRRTDLIRFDQFAGITARNWNWKGGVQAGTAIPETRNLFPIPQTIVGVQGFKQNPGY